MLKRLFSNTVQIGIVVVLVLIGLVIAFRPFANQEESDSDTLPPSFADKAQPRMSVPVFVPTIVSDTVEIEASGSITYRNTVGLVPQVNGRVVWVSESLRNGASFEKDQILFRLDPIDSQLSVEQANADLQVSLAELTLTQAEQEAAIENYLLLNPNSDVPSRVSKEPQVARSVASVKRAEARLSAAELALTRTEFSLPFNGRVLNTTLGIGQLVSMNQVVGEVYSVDNLEAVLSVSNLDVRSLDPVVGRSVKIQIENGWIEAIVERQSAQLDNRTRTATLYASLITPDHALLPGSFIEGSIIGNRVNLAFILPNETEQANNTVWIVRDNKILKQKINIHDRREDGMLVDSFNFHDGVILGAMPDLEEGDEVNIGNERS